ncbi:AAA family ATPase [Thiomicrorhabdus sp.]|uniref:AAA family ATPase n=1 Tax=Thiomicrorhabdus sp. TaxID=2039724 RepID=UPI0029C77DD1|nr:AAA family ATPase [Thiomicrorhabdus sp.]
MINSNDFISLSRLALEGRDADIRLFLAKLVRKLRKAEPAIGGQLEELLKINPARSSSVLRKDAAQHDQSTIFDPAEKSEFPLIKTFEKTSSEEEPILENPIKQQLEQIIVERKSLTLLQKNGLQPTSSMILQGPPGVGKTMSAKWLAAKLDLPLYILDLTAVMSSYLGKTGSNLRSVIEFAKSHPCVLLLDEIDAIAKRRSDDSDVGELKRLVTVMLQELENWPSTGILIAATNHPELVDPALWRRFDIEINFHTPSINQVHNAVIHFLGKDETHFKQWIELIVAGLSGTSYSNIKRTILKLRKLRILNPSELEQNILKHILPNIGELSRDEKINLAVGSVVNQGMSQLKAAKLFGVSRDTIRKRINSVERGE